MHIILAIVSFTILAKSAANAVCDAGAGQVGLINKYSSYESFGSVVVKCPIQKTWQTVGNAENWLQAVIGSSLVNITTIKGNGRQLGSKFNYFVKTPTGLGRTQQRLIHLSDFNFNLISTFDSSTLPLLPWTTFVTLDRITFIDQPVDYTLISFAQQGTINVEEKRKEMIRKQVQGFFNSIFAPALKKTFDNC